MGDDETSGSPEIVNTIGLGESDAALVLSSLGEVLALLASKVRRVLAETNSTLCSVYCLAGVLGGVISLRAQTESQTVKQNSKYLLRLSHIFSEAN